MGVSAPGAEISAKTNAPCRTHTYTNTAHAADPCLANNVGPASMIPPVNRRARDPTLEINHQSPRERDTQPKKVLGFDDKIRKRRARGTHLPPATRKRRSPETEEGGKGFSFSFIPVLFGSLTTKMTFSAPNRAKVGEGVTLS